MYGYRNETHFNTTSFEYMNKLIFSSISIKYVFICSTKLIKYKTYRVTLDIDEGTVVRCQFEHCPLQYQQNFQDKVTSITFKTVCNKMLKIHGDISLSCEIALQSEIHKDSLQNPHNYCYRIRFDVSNSSHLFPCSRLSVAFLCSCYIRLHITIFTTSLWQSSLY